jgi:hypothetical protein
MEQHVANATITSVNSRQEPGHVNYTVRLDEGGGIETVERPSWLDWHPQNGSRVEIVYTRTGDGEPPCARIEWIEQ